MGAIIRWVLLGLFGLVAAGAGVGFALHRAGAQGVKETSVVPAAPDPALAEIRDALKAILTRLDAKGGSAPAPDPFLPYAEGYARALAAGKPLAVWVNYKCGSTSCQLPEFVHARAGVFNGSSAPRVIVGVPDGGGFVAPHESVAAPDVCATNLRAALSPPPPPSTALAWSSAAAVPPMMPMGGGSFRGGG